MTMTIIDDCGGNIENIKHRRAIDDVLSEIADRLYAKHWQEVFEQWCAEHNLPERAVLEWLHSSSPDFSEVLRAKGASTVKAEVNDILRSGGYWDKALAKWCEGHGVTVAETERFLAEHE